MLLDAAEKSIPKSNGQMKRKMVPWWTDDCSRVVKEKNKTLRILRRAHNYQNLIKYKQIQAKVKKTIRNAKRQ